MVIILATFIHYFFYVYSLMIFIYIISSWIPKLQEYFWMHWIASIINPYINVFRYFIPPLGGIDLSPMIATFCLKGIEVSLIRFLTLF